MSASCKILGLFNEPKESWDSFKKIGKISPEEIEILIDQRNEARSKKDFSTSDEIRKLLNDKGVEIKDNGDKTAWKYK